MNEMKSILENAQSIVEFAEEKGWSEEELAKVINLLHSELESNINRFSLIRHENLE